MIRFEGVWFWYRRERGTSSSRAGAVLAGVDLTLGAGLTLIVGPNGCGKSTLLKLAAGVERPDRGRVEVLGRDLWRDEAEARRPLAYVPEQPDLTPYATVSEILGLVCRLRGEPPARGAEALTRLGLGRQAGDADLADLSQRSVRELSMGQRRRALLAAAQIGTPRVVLLDEPLETLDRAAREAVLAWCDELVAAGAAVLVVSHDLEPFAPRAARALTVAAGSCRLVEPLPGRAGERSALLEALARGEDPDWRPGAPPAR
jgi:ABC-type multidrug transport system ATPase subunit